ncbi:MAG: TetR/AcrR family transcriptional regulator [Firmicutes bacterium]|nr:TetR/AcrR family transcriptional regulator [Bacillota bacterium]
MAQVLKDDIRDSIISSAKEEFLEHGFEGSSMRRIAQKSRITVGNLYRYFKNKDELNSFIVSPTYSAIGGIVKDLTGGRVILGEEDPDFSASLADLKEMLTVLSDRLVDIYKSHRAELNILMMGSKLNRELSSWFAGMIASIISRYYGMDRDDKRVSVISGCYAQSIFNGIKEILRTQWDSEEELRSTVKVYLNSYLSMLSADAQQLIF